MGLKLLHALCTRVIVHSVHRPLLLLWPSPLCLYHSLRASTSCPPLPPTHPNPPPPPPPPRPLHLPQLAVAGSSPSYMANLIALRDLLPGADISALMLAHPHLVRLGEARLVEVVTQVRGVATAAHRSPPQGTQGTRAGAG
jgi:hypothetical protein